MAETQFTAITEAAELDTLAEQSARAPVLLFKHDPWCSISLSAYRELERVGGDISLIDVADSHDLSMEAARRTGVRHESPQLIVLRNGEAAWSAAHFAISADAVTQARAAATSDGETGTA